MRHVGRTEKDEIQSKSAQKEIKNINFLRSNSRNGKLGRSADNFKLSRGECRISDLHTGSRTKNANNVSKNDINNSIFISKFLPSANIENVVVNEDILALNEVLVEHLFLDEETRR